MEINQETIKFFKNNKDKLCNDFIFNGMVAKLELIDFSILDNSKSHWNEVNEQSQIHKEYKIVIESKNGNQLPITFLLWNSFDNTYIGKESYHIADDATVRNEKEYQEYSKFLYYLFDCNIKETIFYKNNKVVGYNYEFINNGNTVHRISHNKLFKIFYDNKIVNLYDSWIK